jgi:hypothetical protein
VLESPVAEKLPLPNLRAYARGLLVAVAAERQNAPAQKEDASAIGVPTWASAARQCSRAEFFQQKVGSQVGCSMRPARDHLDEPRAASGPWAAKKRHLRPVCAPWRTRA